MARKATGEVRQKADGSLSARIRMGGSRETFDLPTCKSPREARERAQLLAELAKHFEKTEHVPRTDALKVLKMLASAAPRSVPSVQTLAEELLSGELVDDSDVPTFGELVHMWADGELAKMFPHQIKMAGQGHLDTARARVKKDCFDPIRDVPVNLITRRMCDEVMRNLPLPPRKTEISPSTRRQYALLITRAMNLAELAGYIERSPIPKGWIPKPGPRKRFPILYPAEDRQLLACEDVPFCWRIFYGFLHREGTRREEAVALQVRDIDFEHETVNLDENKTDHPRFWKLAPGVAAALKAYVEKREAGPDDLVFVDENGGAMPMHHMADRVRGHLKAAGIKRLDLFSEGPNKGRFGTHGFRRSFVTRSLALGRPDDWVRQRTGHTTDELLRYRQGAKALAELSLGDVDPLNRAIPELITPGLPRDPSGREDSNLRPLDPQSQDGGSLDERGGKTRGNVAQRRPSLKRAGHSRGNQTPFPVPSEDLAWALGALREEARREAALASAGGAA